MRRDTISERKNGLLAIDVGGGTQDILVYLEGQTIENCPKMVMPSPTRLVAAQIKAATLDGKPVFLFGELMGGGSSTGALREHISAGLPVYATERVALTFHDDLERVRQMGVVVTNQPPSGAVHIEMGDVNMRAIASSLESFGVSLPQNWAVAVQDHGFSPRASNRETRFSWYSDFIDSDGRLEELAFREPPSLFTRMLAVKNLLPGAVVMDTGPAAIWGATTDSVVRERLQEGLVVVNVGNYHVMCAMVHRERITGLLEHHTGMLDSSGLTALIDRFRNGAVSNDEVLAAGGHGCHVNSAALRRGSFSFVAVTGPRRGLLSGGKAHMAAPHGDMMLTGCFGLVNAARKLGIVAG